MKTRIILSYCLIILISCAKEQHDAFDPHTLLEISADPAMGVADNESYVKVTVTIKQVRDGINAIAPDKRIVVFSSNNLGEFKNDSGILADSEGKCVNYIKSSSPGTALVTATLGSYKVTTEITFSEPIPAHFIDSSGIIGPNNVVADGYTVITNQIRFKTGELIEREFRLDSGKFSNNENSIDVLPDASGIYTLHIRADRPGTDRLQVVINKKVYLLRLLTYDPVLPVGSASYAGPDSITADGVSLINARVTLNTADKPQRKFKLQKGRFDNNDTVIDAFPDASGVYHLRIRSSETGTDNLTVQIGSTNYLVKILTYTNPQPTNANSYSGPASVSADDVTYINATVTLNTPDQPQRTFTLQKGIFDNGSNGSKNIDVWPDASGKYNLRIKSAETGSDNLMVLVSGKTYLVKVLTYTPFSPVNVNSYSGPDNVQADGASIITATISLNTTDKPPRTFTLQKGTFEDETQSISVLPDAAGNYTLRIKSQVLGTDNLKLLIGNQTYLVKSLVYFPSLPDGLYVELVDGSSIMEYEAFKTVAIRVTLTKSYGVVNLGAPLTINLAATDSSGNTIGQFINPSLSTDKTVYTHEFYLTDTTYNGIITFKASYATLSLSGERSVYFKPK